MQNGLKCLNLYKFEPVLTSARWSLENTLVSGTYATVFFDIVESVLILGIHFVTSTLANVISGIIPPEFSEMILIFTPSVLPRNVYFCASTTM